MYKHNQISQISYHTSSNMSTANNTLQTLAVYHSYMFLSTLHTLSTARSSAWVGSQEVSSGLSAFLQPLQGPSHVLPSPKSQTLSTLPISAGERAFMEARLCARWWMLKVEGWINITLIVTVSEDDQYWSRGKHMI